MRRPIASIVDVAERQLCAGCGACAYMQPDEIEMVDDLDAGRRPLVRPGADTSPSLAVCPGIELAHDDVDRRVPAGLASLRREWGPVLEVWEGHASDDEVRYAGSSGGMATALALFGVESMGMAGVLHIAARDDVPYLNETVFSTTRDEMLRATGSRYAPASPCDGLATLEGRSAPSVFIGKPCDVAGAWRAARARPRLDDALGLTIAIFCAGTPTTRGTLEMIGRMGFADPGSVTSVRYRGNGWPGLAVVESDDEGTPSVRSLSYEQSWGEILERHRQWRCRVCPDHTGEFADIAVGDPWYRDVGPRELGESLVLVRTERGREVLERARAAGVVTLARADADVVRRSQPNLERARGAVWGRLLGSRLSGMPVPRFRNLPMFPAWLHALSAKEKVASIVGTTRRVRARGLRRPRPVRPMMTEVRS